MSQTEKYHNLVILYSSRRQEMLRAKEAAKRSCLCGEPLKVTPGKPSYSRLRARIASFDQELSNPICDSRQIENTAANTSSAVIKPRAILFLRTDAASNDFRLCKLTQLSHLSHLHNPGFPEIKTLAARIKGGFGFDKAPAAGGFDEIAVRNESLKLALKLCEEQGCAAQYTTFLDADEFILVDKLCTDWVRSRNADILAYKTQQTISLTELDMLAAKLTQNWRVSMTNKANLLDRLNQFARCNDVDKQFALYTNGEQRESSMRNTMVQLKRLKALIELLFESLSTHPSSPASSRYALVPDTTGVHPRTISNSLIRSGRVKWKQNHKMLNCVNTTQHCVLSVVGSVNIVAGNENYIGLHGHQRSSKTYLSPLDVTQYVHERLFSKDVMNLLTNEMLTLAAIAAKQPNVLDLIRDSGLGYLALRKA